MTMKNEQAEVLPEETAEAEALRARDACFLQSKNIRFKGKRTSVRLEPEMWRALVEIAAMENSSVSKICLAVFEAKDDSVSFTAALRVFLIEYFRRKCQLQTAQPENEQQKKSPLHWMKSFFGRVD